MACVHLDGHAPSDILGDIAAALRLVDDGFDADQHLAQMTAPGDRVHSFAHEPRVRVAHRVDEEHPGREQDAADEQDRPLDALPANVAVEEAADSGTSARQRAGRAGRTAPGRAIRLWTQASEFRRRAFDEPEVERIDLSQTVLDIVSWSGADPGDFPWFEPPPRARLGAAEVRGGRAGYRNRRP